MNKDPTTAEESTPNLELTTLQLGVAGSRYEMWRTNLIYTMPMVQHIANPAGTYVGNFNGYSPGYSASFFETRYGGGTNGSNFLRTVMNANALIDEIEGKPEQVNLLAATRIMRVLTFQRLTDVYGDIPYFDAGKGALEGKFTPHYTRQDSIYMDLHDELRAAVDQFDASQPALGDEDLLFRGDINQWKRFANSLQLRLALRLVKVRPDLAQSWAEEAVNADGGVMQGIDDDAYVSHQSGPSGGPAGFNTNANSEVMQTFAGQWLSETFVDWMKDKNDPRLTEYGALAPGGLDSALVEDPVQQRGMPNGFDNNELADSDEYTDDLDQYTRIHPNLRGLDAPMFFQTYAEVELMLAEAAVRGWNVPGSVEAHYEDGVRAAMNYITRYDEDNTKVSDSEITQYLSDNPLPSGREARLRVINNQYWAATFLNGIESWSNWRRSGYPELTPAPEQGDTGGQFIRRLDYPQGERDLNGENYQEARERQNITQSNRLTPRVWWDCGAYADQCAE
ncbi:SusD/RagB family nutrient-binding outer membrane lipoprotein [Salinibacter grassmerensis]|uniref:SusD/RagB family nutrient-binding outer membrane lipoprotein n=1 Tax=Salinibacter grassmerensis TaxID=3040353 RepID=UPI0021E8B95F|nr:SusD/RagB family nutrient-binding outer membrane lipoprotein [Salinibacter grassmerensis]